MSESIQTQGKTVEEAIAEACLQLGLRRDEVDVRITQEPKSGLLGFLGGRPAKVVVRKKPERHRGRGGNNRSEEDGAHSLGRGRGGRGRSRGGRGRGGRGGQGGQVRPGGNQGGQQQEPAAGPYQLTIYHDDGEDEITIDVDKAEEGWNLLGNFYLSPGKAKVSLSNETEGKLVIADAVKWVKVN
jgi:predicted RNA-binding protein Jag